MRFVQLYQCFLCFLQELYLLLLCLMTSVLLPRDFLSLFVQQVRRVVPSQPEVLVAQWQSPLHFVVRVMPPFALASCLWESEQPLGHRNKGFAALCDFRFETRSMGVRATSWT